MSTTISVGTTSGTAFNVTPDTSGQLVVQTNGSTTALTLTTAQNAVFAGSVNAINTFAFKNRLIDAGFIINQRAYTSGTSLSSGVYGHDRWKAGSGGGTYTFTQGSLGVPITITITAGTIQQVIEGCNVAEGGTYTLSWSGTATARINSGSYAASPITVTGQTAGANMTIEFATGTVLRPQLETGSQGTGFDYRAYPTEFAFCQRYYEVGGVSQRNGNRGGGTYQTQDCYYKVTKRTTPTFTIAGGYTADGWNSYSVGGHNNPSGSNDVTNFGNLEVVTSGGVGGSAVFACTWISSAEL